jgi:hypothetical protein
MLCSTCGGAFTPGRLFCLNCGAVSPEGASVMGVATEPALPPIRTVQGVSTPLGTRPAAMPRRAAPTSPTAVVSLIFGILSYVAFPFVGALIAVVAGHYARREIRVSGGRMEGMPLATTGMVLGYSQIALVGVAILFVFTVAMLAVATGHH